jgi:hypothetical protein
MMSTSASNEAKASTSAASTEHDCPASPRTTIDLSDFVSLLKNSYSKVQVNKSNLDEKFSSVSFILSSFDNVMGPRVVHYWHFKDVVNEKCLLDEEMLKYIAIRMLNSELYQDKLGGIQKFRYYLIREIERVIFSVFFEASTLSSQYSNMVASNNEVSTSLNCLSMVIPLVYNDEFFFDYVEDTRFLINALENYTIEYKVYAHIKPKVKIK